MEEILLENDKLSVRILPALGGKITSFYTKEKAFELTAPNLGRGYKIPEEDADFSRYDASGMDDAFPNIDAECINFNGQELHFPDHGEIWSHPMEMSAGGGCESIRLNFCSRRFPYCYEKSLRLADRSLILHYIIRNTGKDDFPCIWTWHGLMKYEEDMEFLLSDSLKMFRNVLDSPELGQSGRLYARKNSCFDFCHVPPRNPVTMVKYYAEGHTGQGMCGVVYPSGGVRFTMSYDPEKLPFLGVWVTAGGFRGDYNCALEPSNGFYDSISNARQNSALKILKPSEVFEFEIKMTLETM